MAEDAIDAAVKVLGMDVPKSSTSGMQLLGADRVGVVCDAKFDKITVTLRNEYLLSKELANHLTHNYGTRALQIAEIRKAQPSLGKQLHSRHVFIEAEVIFAVEQEYAMTVEDVIARRMRLAFVDSRAAAEATPIVANLMAKQLGWSKAYTNEQILKTIEFLQTMHSGDPKELEILAKIKPPSMNE